jgi:formyl-CoA transferase
MNIFSGLKVVECATYIAAPAAAVMLAEYGAEVIKIERPPHGDPYRYLPLVPGVMRSEHQYTWILDDRNKRSIALDLNQDAARDALLALVRQADVFITNYPPGLQRKFRLTDEDLRPLNARLIFAQVTGYGESGADADRPGYDATAYWARSGLMEWMHNAGSDPCLSPVGFGDHPTASALYGSIVTALYQRERTGEGRKVSVSLIAAGAWSNSAQLQAAMLGATRASRAARSRPLNPLVNHYVTSDGQRFLLCLLDVPKDWTNLCRAVERPEWEHDPRFATGAARTDSAAELVQLLDAIVAQRTLEEWARVFAHYDLIWGLVPDVFQVAADPQLRAAGAVTTIDDFPGGPRPTVSSPLMLHGVAKEPARYAPGIGQHTREVLREAGLTEAAIDALYASGAAYTKT